MSRSARTLLVGAVVVAVVALLLIGGALRTSSQSLPYLRDVNRSYAAQAAVLAARSNAIDRQLASAVPAMAASSRPDLVATLDTLVQAAESVAAQAEQLDAPAPTGGAGIDLTQAFADRATALEDLRRTVSRLLVLSPLPVVTSAEASDSVGPTPPSLSSSAAVTDLERVGAEIAASNRSYAAGRHALRAGPGRASVPASMWQNGAASWSATGALSLVNALTTSATLAPQHQVVLVTDALALTPAPVPPAAGASPTIVEIPPTNRLVVSAVVSDQGNVPARHVTVDMDVAPQTGKPASRRSATVSLGPGGATTVVLPAAQVAPDGHYTVTVTVTPPVANATASAATTDTLAVAVGPPSPPAVNQVAPAKGPARGGTHVVILGSGFTQATAVKFGTTDARFTVVSNTEIKAVSPPGTGTVLVTVENAGGPSGYSATHQFTYKGSGGSPGTTTTTTVATSAATTSTTGGG